MPEFFFLTSHLIYAFRDDSKTGSEPKCPRDREPIPQEGGVSTKLSGLKAMKNRYLWAYMWSVEKISVAFVANA